MTLTAAARATLLAVLLTLAISACGAPSRLLEQAGLSRTTLTPSTTDRLDLAYTLSRAARVSLSLAGPTGATVALLADEPRPAAGALRPRLRRRRPLADRPGERRVLPDGAYRLSLDARDGAGRSESASFDFQIAGADLSAPGVEGLAVYPAVMTPNFDGVDDVASITYRLTKRARVFAFATDPAGQRVYVGTQELLEPGEYREVWDGTNKDRPLPDGTYQFAIRATDLAGNTVVGQTPVAIQSSGRPDARIIRISFTPRRLMLGDELQIEAVVRNVGTVPLRTQGPDPGFVYSSFDSFGTR